MVFGYDFKLDSDSFKCYHSIPSEFAFCKPDPAQRVTLSSNLNPHLKWWGACPHVKSYVLLCRDRYAPAVRDDVNKEGRELPHNLKRTDFYHWVLVDIPLSVSSIEQGSHSSSVMPRGKDGPQAPGAMRHGLNDYTEWFAGDPEMAGNYFGYDGPCPPWNDAKVHWYRFEVFGLLCEKTPVEGVFTGRDVYKAIQGHVVESAYIEGTYTLNQADAG